MGPPLESQTAMKTFSLLLLTLFAIFSMAYTLKSSKKQDDDDDTEAIMRELMRGVVAQVQEEEDQRSSAELESALSDLLSQVQQDGEDGRIQDDEGGRIQDGDDEDGRIQDGNDEGGKQDDGDIWPFFNKMMMVTLLVDKTMTMVTMFWLSFKMMTRVTMVP